MTQNNASASPGGLTIVASRVDRRRPPKPVVVGWAVLDRAFDPRGNRFSGRDMSDTWISLAAIGAAIVVYGLATSVGHAGLEHVASPTVSAVRTYVEATYACGRAIVTEHGGGIATVTFFDDRGRLLDVVDRVIGQQSTVYDDAAQAIVCGEPLEYDVR